MDAFYFYKNCKRKEKNVFETGEELRLKIYFKTREEIINPLFGISIQNIVTGKQIGRAHV